MRDILPELNKWAADHEKIALATVTQTWGSSPRGIGAQMAFTGDGKITGSVSGGCVEGAVIGAGLDVLATKHPHLIHFGVADEMAWTVGLACGGQIDVFVNVFNGQLFPILQKKLQEGHPICLATLISGPDVYVGREMLVSPEDYYPTPISSSLESDIVATARKILSEGRSQVATLETADKERVGVFFNIIDPQPVLVIVGGVQIAVALTSLAKTLGFLTIVIDPRRAFGSPDRFPDAGRLIQLWPDEAFNQVSLNERTAIAILTHDPKIDDPALLIALQSPAFYVGALGSSGTQENRRKRLIEAGISQDQLARLHGPIGLKLGSQTPEEIALAILAEIVAVQRRALA